MTDQTEPAPSSRATKKSKEEPTMSVATPVVTPTQTAVVTPATSVVPGIPKAVMNNEETIATHITAALAAFGGAMALVHPGFHLPATAQEVVVPVAWLIAGGLEIYNLVTKRSLKKAVIAKLK